MFQNDLGNTIHNDPMVEMSQMSINRRLDQQSVISRTMEYFSAIKRSEDCTCYNLDEPQIHAEGKRADINGHDVYDCFHRNIQTM